MSRNHRTDKIYGFCAPNLKDGQKLMRKKLNYNLIISKSHVVEFVLFGIASFRTK